MPYFDDKKNAFVPYQKDGATIITVNEKGEKIEVDNPDYTPWVYYSQEEVDNFFEQERQGYKRSSENGYVKMIPPDENEIAKQQAKSRISELKTYLFETDYQAIKFAEGELSAEDYAEMKAQRAEWRAEINQLEQTFGIKSVFGG